MIKCERRVDVVDVVQKVEEVQVILLRDSLAMVPEPLFNTLDLLDLFLLRITGVGQQKLRKVSFGNVAVFVRILPHELESQDFALQLVLEVQELFDLQLLIEFSSKKVAAESRVHALQEIFVNFRI